MLMFSKKKYMENDWKNLKILLSLIYQAISPKIQHLI